MKDDEMKPPTRNTEAQGLAQGQFQPRRFKDRKRYDRKRDKPVKTEE